MFSANPHRGLSWAERSCVIIDWSHQAQLQFQRNLQWHSFEWIVILNAISESSTPSSNITPSKTFLERRTFTFWSSYGLWFISNEAKWIDSRTDGFAVESLSESKFPASEESQFRKKPSQHAAIVEFIHKTSATACPLLSTLADPLRLPPREAVLAATVAVANCNCSKSSWTFANFDCRSSAFPPELSNSLLIALERNRRGQRKVTKK